MPTYDVLRSFWRDWEGLTPDQQRRFLTALQKFVADLRARSGFRAGLRVKGVQGAVGIYELTWADDGRATFEYGDAIVEGEPHIVWRRIGTHEILDTP
jgi:hypothetical protein